MIAECARRGFAAPLYNAYSDRRGKLVSAEYRVVPDPDPRWPYCLVFYRHRRGLEPLCATLVRWPVHPQRPRGCRRGHVDPNAQPSSLWQPSPPGWQHDKPPLDLRRSLASHCFGGPHHRLQISVRAKGNNARTSALGLRNYRSMAKAFNIHRAHTAVTMEAFRVFLVYNQGGDGLLPAKTDGPATNGPLRNRHQSIMMLSTVSTIGPGHFVPVVREGRNQNNARSLITPSG